MSESSRVLAAIGLLLVLTVPAALGDGYALEVVDLALINALVVVGLNFVTGWTGQVNFGQAAFFGIGAYATAIASKAGIPWIATPAIAALLAATASLFLGLPTLRLRTFYLAMATIGFGEIVRLVLLHWEPVTGGSSGLRAIPGISLGPLAPVGNVQHFYILLAILALATLIAWRIRRSRLGRAMIATRDSEIAAELGGIDTVRIKIVALLLAAIYAGIAGCFYASYLHYISPDTFTNSQAVLFFTMLVIGGTGSLAGAIVGALLLTFLPELFRSAGQYYLVCYGVGVIAVIILAPRGLAGAVAAGARALATRLRPAR
jgi:branched-chain amino acid transport system permease protein